MTIGLIKRIVAIGILSIGGVLVVGIFGCGKPSDPPRPGEAGFDAANAQITAYKESAKKTAFGNSAEAVELAANFSKRITVLERIMFKDSAKASPPPSGGNFPTYCRLSDENVCFLVHVPQLRDFKQGKTRDALLKIAWITAQKVTEELRKTNDRKLAVGLRGARAYGAIATGMGNADPANETGIMLANSKLYGFFAKP